MQLEVGQVGHPDQRRQVVANAVLDASDLARGHPLWPVRGAVLLVEELPLDAVRVALQREGATAQVRQQRRRHARVVVDHLALGDAHRRVHHLVQVREAELPPLDLDPYALGGGYDFLAAGFLAAGFLCERDLEPFELLADRFCLGLLWPLLCAMLASSAAIRSGTFFGSSAGASTTTSSPCALRSIMSSTRSRYSSRYLSGSKPADSESINCCAMSSSRLLVFLVSAASGTPSSLSGSIT